MRNAAVLIHSTPLSKMASTAAKAMFTPPATVQRSPWHSPVPYLFGGLAAMLGLIAFALLILACSYWNASAGAERDVEAGKGEGSSDTKAPPVFDEKFLVIMAGDVNPTFLATPMINNKTSFLNDEKEKEKEEKVDEKDVTAQQNGDEGY